MIFKLVSEAIEKIQENTATVVTVVICEVGLALVAVIICDEDKARSFWHIFLGVNIAVAKFALYVAGLVLVVGLCMVIWDKLVDRLGKYVNKNRREM